VLDDLVTQSIEMPRGDLRLLQPGESAELPDSGGVEWAPIAPYWSVLWRSGVALARELDRVDLRGQRVVELGCGLGLPSLAAARAGADVLATDTDPEALELLVRNAEANGLRIEAARVDWAEPDELIRRAPFELVLAADVLYERQSVAQLLSLLPQLGPQSWLADPGRPGAEAFLDRLDHACRAETHTRGVVRLYRLRFQRGASALRPPREPAGGTPPPAR
jgi:predicted nicotinamide N-methyase